MNAWKMIGLAGLCLVVVGCGGGGGSGSCEEPLLQCGSDCIDVQADAAHCGGCDRPCPAGEECLQGSCVEPGSCPAGKERCGARCVDLQADAAHCGGCDRPCPEGEECLQGSCVEPGSCPAGTERCGDLCVDTDTDPSHCGSCGNACPEGLGCEGGECFCPGGLLACDGSCVDTNTDPSHCGGCGDACPTGAGCEAGHCVCPEGRDECAGACVDRRTDPAHCGACGHACVGDLVCDDGACACPADREECDPGTCSDLDSDPLHCGSCGNTCTGGTVCADGACACPAGLLDCEGTCIDPRSDAAHCGACGVYCAEGLVCRDGGCSPVACVNGLGLPGPSRLDAGVVFRGVALGDLDDDGDTDLLVAEEEGEGALRWFQNLGGGFADPVDFAIPPVPFQELLVADLDGEGPLDVVGVSNSYHPNLYLFLRNSADAPVAVHLEWPRRTKPFIPKHPRAADLDADGDLDLVLSDYNAYEILVARNLGDGTFEAIEEAVPLPPGARPYGLAIGDMDGNGYDDLVVAEGHRLYTIRTVGPFEFVPGEVYENGSQHAGLALGDFDGDGDLDVVLDEGHMARNDGTGNFSDYGALREWQTLVAYMATGDVDGDGDVDFVGTTFDAFEVLFNRGDHFVTHRGAAGIGAKPPHLADLDGDGRLDFVVPATRSRWIDVFLNPGDGRYVAPYRFEHFYGTSPALALGEIDSSFGAELLLVPGEQRWMHLVYVTPDGPIVLQHGGAAAYTGLALVEIDGDPEAEYATIDPEHATLDFLEGWPPTHLGSVEIGTGAKSLVALDVDGDGARDLAILEEGPEPGLRLLLADEFASAPIVPLAGGAIPHMALPVDLDGDGHQELLVASDQALHVFESDGTTLVEAEQHGIVARALAAGDLDGDGRPEIVAADADEDRIVVVSRNVWGFDTDQIPVAAASLAIADLDADGWNDLVALTDSVQALTVFPGSPGGFAPSYSWPGLILGRTALLATDLDGDYRPDIFAVDSSSGMYYPSGCLP